MDNTMNVYERPATRQGPFPVELVEKVFDSITDYGTLIRLSHTCVLYRQVAGPITKFQKCQRLLELELLPKYGEIPSFNLQGHPDPALHEVSRWKPMKYACCGCERLLPQEDFDNHAVLAERFRKPDMSLMTAKSSDTQYHASSFNFIQRGDARSRFQRRRRFVDAAQGGSSHVIGRHRISRRCIACRFQRGDFSRPTTVNRGSRYVPAIKVRSSLRVLRQYVDVADSSPWSEEEDLSGVWERGLRCYPPRIETYLAYPAELRVRCEQCGTFKKKIEFGLFSLNLGIADALKCYMQRPVICFDCTEASDGRDALIARLVAFRKPLLEGQVSILAWDINGVVQLVGRAADSLSCKSPVGQAFAEELNLKDLSMRNIPAEATLPCGIPVTKCWEWLRSWEKILRQLCSFQDSLKAAERCLEQDTRTAVTDGNWRKLFTGDKAAREGCQVDW